MGLTSRQKRPLDRQISSFRDTRLIIIAAEGEKTEKQYFESKLFDNRRVQVKVLPAEDGKSAPKHVYERLKEYTENFDLQRNDQLWLVVDRDHWPDAQLSEVCSHAVGHRRIRCQPAISNPCFELWLYLHHADWTLGPKTSSEVVQGLRTLLGSYNKSKLDIDRYSNGIDDAVRRSKGMDKQPKGRWPDNPGTHVYNLVEAIRRLQTGT